MIYFTIFKRKEKRYNRVIRNLTSTEEVATMCGANIFPEILRIAGIPQTLHARTEENDSVTLGQIFADRPESEFLHAVKIFEQLKAGEHGGITRETTIGELRAATRKRIIDGAIEYLSLTGSDAEKMRTRLQEEFLRT